MQRNGLLVLAKIPGLLEHIDGSPMEEFHLYSVVPEDPGLLSISDHPRRQREAVGANAIRARIYTFAAISRRSPSSSASSLRKCLRTRLEVDTHSHVLSSASFGGALQAIFLPRQK